MPPTPPPRSLGSTPGTSPSTMMDARIEHLFRSPAGGDLHPLHTQLRRYRAGTHTAATALSGPTSVASPVAPGADTVGPSTAAHSIDRTALQQRVRELPPLPQAAVQALAALRNDSASAEHCGDLIARDQALVARLLRLANSAFYGVSGRVSTVRDAVQLLGRRTVGSLLAVATVSQQFDRRRCPSFDFSGFWRHALAVALASRALALEVDVDEDQAFVGGLLHDIGRLTLAVHFPVQVDALMQAAGAIDSPLNAMEFAHLGTDHAEVGAWVAAHWCFAPDVVAMIAAHHQPPAGVDAAQTLATLVHVADAMVHALDLESDAHERVPVIASHAWTRLRLTPEAVLGALASTETGVIDLCEAMGL
ncbi:MAG: HDOD domain-containing protein [Chitinophagaceae bacterium]|nr:HDOD domain-containing protein [Rubrivivax sp.]